MTNVNESEIFTHFELELCDPDKGKTPFDLNPGNVPKITLYCYKRTIFITIYIAKKWGEIQKSCFCDL